MNMTSLIAANPWWDTSIGGVAQALLAGVGLIVLVVSAIKAFGKFSQGRVGEGVRVIMSAVIISVLLFRPQILESMVDVLSNVVDSVIGSADEVIDDNL